MGGRTAKYIYDCVDAEAIIPFVIVFAAAFKNASYFLLIPFSDIQ